MLDDERIVLEGTDIASWEIIDSVTTVRQSRDEGSELPEVEKNLYERSSEGLDGLQKNQLYSLLVDFKEEAVTKWPRPTNKRDLRGF